MIFFFKTQSSRNFTAFQKLKKSIGTKQRNIKSTKLHFLNKVKRIQLTKKHLKIPDYFKDQTSSKVISFLPGTYSYKKQA